jgi:pimeloyl-ACP methyl ester carboxylesterase
MEPQVRTGTVQSGGARIHYEVVGSGPAVLGISGATGDAAHLAAIAEALSGEYTFVTYDRRAHSRSPRPDGWSQTSADEQGDDAAAIIRSLGVAPVTVFGSSSGAIIALNVALRYPDFVVRAILHDPAMMSVLEHPEAPMAVVQPVVEAGMARGGPRAAVEDFITKIAGAPWEDLDAGMRERMQANGEVFFGSEFGSLETWRPTDEALRETTVPITAMTGEKSPPFFGETARWVADHAGTKVVSSVGGHVPYWTDATVFADQLRAELKKNA